MVIHLARDQRKETVLVRVVDNTGFATLATALGRNPRSLRQPGILLLRKGLAGLCKLSGVL